MATCINNHRRRINPVQQWWLCIVIFLIFVECRRDFLNDRHRLIVIRWLAISEENGHWRLHSSLINKCSLTLSLGKILHYFFLSSPVYITYKRTRTNLKMFGFNLKNATNSNLGPKIMRMSVYPPKNVRFFC